MRIINPGFRIPNKHANETSVGSSGPYYLLAMHVECYTMKWFKT